MLPKLKLIKLIISKRKEKSDENDVVKWFFIRYIKFIRGENYLNGIGIKNVLIRIRRKIRKRNFEINRNDYKIIWKYNDSNKRSSSLIKII